MDILPDNVVERALVVVAHPDDAKFWAGGTVACWSRSGTAVTYLVLTDGDAGGFDAAMPRRDIPRIRRSEQKAAARILGVCDVRFLGLAEGTSCHIDHRATGELALTAVYPDAGNVYAHPTLIDREMLHPWVVEEIWMLNAREPNHFVDVTDTSIKRFRHFARTVVRPGTVIVLQRRCGSESSRMPLLQVSRQVV